MIHKVFGAGLRFTSSGVSVKRAKRPKPATLQSVEMRGFSSSSSFLYSSKLAGSPTKRVTLHLPYDKAGALGSGILEQFSMPKSVTGRKPKRL